MIRAEILNQINRFKRISRSTIWVWLVLIVAILTTASASVFMVQQNQVSSQYNQELGLTHQARVDLITGYLYSTLGQPGGGPFDRNQALNMVDQAALELKKVKDLHDLYSNHQADDVSAQALLVGQIEAVAGFRKLLETWQGPLKSDAGAKTELSGAFSALEDQFSQVDAHLKRDLDNLELNNTRLYAIFLGTAGLLLVALCVVVFQGIRARQLAREELYESESRYRSLVQVSPDAIYLIRDERLIFSNPAGLLLLGAEQAEQILGKSPFDVFHPASHAVLRRKLAEMLEHGLAVQPFEEKIMRLDGSARSVEVAAAPVETDDTLDVQMVMRDITERKLAEAELMLAHVELEQRVIDRTRELNDANRALEESAHAKDDFLASMSHELRTPLTGILGLSEALQMVTYGALNDKQRNAIKNIELSGRHLLALINDILDISKIENGKFELQMDICSLGDLCQSSLQLTKGMANQKNQKVSFKMDPASIILRADGRRLKQMLVNLLGNAVKFTAPGGSLGIDVQGLAEKNELHITVWDTGIGIHPEDVPQLFKPFVQLDNSLSRQNTGTGLGLSLVQSLAGLHGGRVDVVSQPEQGSRFTLVLPWAEDVRQKAIQPVPGTGPLALQTEEQAGGPLVLMADDNDMVLELVSDFLVSRNYRVVTTHGGVEFLERLEQVKADIILMDIQMPGMDGVEVIRRLRAHPLARTAALPVVAVTALAMSGDRERCLAAGANAYLSKPVQLKELIVTIEKLCPR